MLWTAPVGVGFGGPAVSDGKVYLLDRDEKVGDKLRVLDLASGKELWTFAYDAPGKFMFAGSRTTPTRRRRPRLHHRTDWATCTPSDTKTRKPAWHKNIWKDFGGGELPRWAIVQNPLIYGNLLIVAPQTPQAGVVAYDKLTGELKWKSAALSGLPGYVSPSIVKIGGEDHLVMVMASVGRGRNARDGSVNGLDPRSGKVLWTYGNWQCLDPGSAAGRRRRRPHAHHGRLRRRHRDDQGSEEGGRQLRRDGAVQEPRLRRPHAAADPPQRSLLLALHDQRAQRRPRRDEHGRPGQVEDRSAAARSCAAGRSWPTACC